MAGHLDPKCNLRREVDIQAEKLDRMVHAFQKKFSCQQVVELPTRPRRRRWGLSSSSWSSSPRN